MTTAAAALRILFAEDNPVNQKITAFHLRRLGYEPKVVSDGLEAVEATRTECFDVVLLDVQMPGMDGLEAARRIRDLGKDPERPWIVALTAHALPSDREECLAAGMNDHLAKPVSAQDLSRALSRAPVAPDSPLLDLEVLGEIADPSTSEGVEFLRELFDSFFETAPRKLDAMREAKRLGDSETLRQAAHSLKGGAAALGLVRLHELAGHLEADSANGLEASSGLLRGLDEAIDEVRTHLREVLPVPPSPSS